MAGCKPRLLAPPLLVLVAVCAGALLWATLPRRSCSGRFVHAAVSADSARCSEVGRNILRRGGSAADGAIAALLCSSVVNPQSMGLGGGSIITVRSKAGDVKVYTSRESVPRSFETDLLADCPTTFRISTGVRWAGVPGELRGYEALHRDHGRLPWAEIFRPVVLLAREGIPLPPFLGKLLQMPLIKNTVESSSLCEVLCGPDKKVLSDGDTLRFPKLAETMETIAEQGAEAFYSGQVGRDLVEDVAAAGGKLTMEDLRSFKVRVEEAWTLPLGAARLHIPPPPSGGALLAFILSIMKEFPLGPHSLDGAQKIQLYHHYVEAAKFANGQRRSISDPPFNQEKSAGHLIDPSFIAGVRGMISSNRTHEDSYYLAAAPPPDRLGTTHVSVVDQDGLAVSATSSINQLFGGTVYSPRTGVILNNQLSDFCGRAENIRAGERPPSSMAPSILETESGGTLVIGASGGSMITSGVALAIVNHLWLGMNLSEAIAAPIVFVDSKNNVNFEPGFDTAVIRGLRALGHRVGDWKYFFNVVNAVEKEGGCIAAVSDGRKMGVAAGY